MFPITIGVFSPLKVLSTRTFDEVVSTVVVVVVGVVVVSVIVVVVVVVSMAVVVSPLQS